MHRQFFHSQRLAQFLKHHRAELVRVGALTLLYAVELELARVLGAELQQSQLVPARGNPECHTLYLHVRQEWNQDF